MGDIYELDDFIDDEMFFTKSQIESYHSDEFKGFKGNIKKSVEKKFLTYYETFEWVRKKKNETYKIVLGSKKNTEDIVFNDKRVSKHHRLLIPIFKNLLYKMNSLNKDGKINTIYSPMMWMYMLNSTNRIFDKEFFKLNSVKEPDFRNSTKQYYFNQRRLMMRNEFKYLEKHFVFYKRVKKAMYGNQSVLMTEDEQDEYNAKNNQLVMKYGKQNSFKKTSNQKKYQEEMQKFLEDVMGCNSVFLAYEIDTSDLECNNEYISNIEFEKYKQLLKNKMDKSIIDKQLKEYRKYVMYCRLENDGYMIPRELINFEYEYKKDLVKLKTFSKFKKYDEQYGFGKTDKAIQEYYDNELSKIEKNKNDYDWIKQEYYKIHKQPLENILKIF